MRNSDKCGRCCCCTAGVGGLVGDGVDPIRTITCAFSTQLDTVVIYDDDVIYGFAVAGGVIWLVGNDREQFYQCGVAGGIDGGVHIHVFVVDREQLGGREGHIERGWQAQADKNRVMI